VRSGDMTAYLVPLPPTPHFCAFRAAAVVAQNARSGPVVTPNWPTERGGQLYKCLRALD
jgi:hypothetical protein